MNINNVNSVYLIGIGGIGMSALARYFNFMKVSVYGYDKTETKLTQQLETEGIQVNYDDRKEAIPESIQQLTSEELMVIYTPAISETNQLISWFKSKDFSLYKRSEVLGLITKNSKTIAVAGTHGKTTTSSILAHLLHSSGYGCNAFLGGITSNYGSNFLFSSANAITVVEADEFDRSFLTLSPDIAVITSMDADHLDIYGAHEELKEGLQLFANLVSTDGTIYLHEDLEAIDSGASQKRYGLSKSVFASSNEVKNSGKWTNTFNIGGKEIKDIDFRMPGEHNLQNALVASAICSELGMSANSIKKGLESFKGIKRRFEYHIENKQLVYIDDYAHHPTELNATISAVKAHYPSKKITGIFQPHLFSRTRDFMSEFAQSLAELDEIYLLDIYPAREDPIEGVDSQSLLDKIPNPSKKLVDKIGLLKVLEAESLDVLLTLGAGDIDQLIHPICNKLNKTLI